MYYCCKNISFAFFAHLQKSYHLHFVSRTWHARIKFTKWAAIKLSLTYFALNVFLRNTFSIFAWRSKCAGNATGMNCVLPYPQHANPFLGHKYLIVVVLGISRHDHWRCLRFDPRHMSTISPRMPLWHGRGNTKLLTHWHIEMQFAAPCWSHRYKKIAWKRKHIITS